MFDSSMSRVSCVDSSTRTELASLSGKTKSTGLTRSQIPRMAAGASERHPRCARPGATESEAHIPKHQARVNSEASLNPLPHEVKLVLILQLVGIIAKYEPGNDQVELISRHRKPTLASFYKRSTLA